MLQPSWLFAVGCWLLAVGEVDHWGAVEEGVDAMPIICRRCCKTFAYKQAKDDFPLAPRSGQ